MVKGISRQVIVVNDPEKGLFEQAIFILKDGQKPVSDAMLLREAKRLVGTKRGSQGDAAPLRVAAWVASGAVGASLIWLIFLLF